MKCQTIRRERERERGRERERERELFCESYGDAMLPTDMTCSVNIHIICLTYLMTLNLNSQNLCEKKRKKKKKKKKKKRLVIYL